ncbi:hypothetical protein NVP1063O_129 [Vibrio phage 1.063.O._10N.261.45.C7]|nr:hypothetical protein NVP1063O_129 [Vibrio phage 1.063.O._10N.261.45.C7]
MKLTEKEKKWFARLEKTLAAAPDSLKKKDGKFLRSFTTGDNDITVYDASKYDTWVDSQNFRLGYEGDVGPQVEKSEAGLYNLVFPFCVESTAG